MFRFFQKRRAGVRRAGFRTAFTMQGDPVFRDEQRRREIYAKVFGTSDGRMVLADILMGSGIASPAWTPGRPQEDAQFNSGCHAMALQIAETAGLNLGALGQAMVEGHLEAMMQAEEPQHD